MFGGEVVERQQRLTVLGQALGGLVVFEAVGLDKGVEGGLGLGPGLGHPDVVQRALGLGLRALGQFVEEVRGFMDPAALAAGLGPHFLDRLAEAERAVGDGAFGSDLEPAALEIEQQFAPRLRPLAHAVDQADRFLLALGGAEDDRQALRVVPEPGLWVAGAVANPGHAHRHRADAGHDLTLGQVAVAHHTAPAVLGQQSGVAVEERGPPPPRRLAQEASGPRCAAPRSVDRKMSLAGKDAKRYCRSRPITPSLEEWGLEHPHDTLPCPYKPPPTFAHSSKVTRASGLDDLNHVQPG